MLKRKLKIPAFWATPLLYLAAFPPLHLSFLVFVALVPWLYYLSQPGAKPVRSGFLVGFSLFFVGSYHIALLTFRWTGSMMLAWIPALGIALIVSVFWMLLGWFLHWAIRTGRHWLLPIVWVAVEGLRCEMQPFGYAWLQLAHPLASFPTMLQLAEFGKEYLVSGWVMLVNMAVWRIFESGMSHKNVRFAVAAFLLFVFSLLRHGTPIVTHPHAITLAQPGFDMAFEQSLEAQRTEAFRMAVYEKSARQPTELIVFPEGIADDWKSFGISAPAPVLFGGLREDKYQTSFLVSKDQIQYLDKTRLVMFGEYVPLRDKFSFLQNFKLGTNDFIPGETDKVLSAGTLRIAPLICFEAIFSEPAGRRAALGANLLTVQSIDDWYRNTRASELLADATVFRSIETGLPCVRVGGLGISQVTDSRGNLLARLPYGEPEVARIQVPIPESGNPWHFGNWIWQICGVICVFLALYDAKKRRTDEKSPLVAESQTK